MGNKQVKVGGFTIVELLTVMAVIAILIGLLIPALNLVRDNAKKLQQKAQFHSIDVGLELYKSEFGAYPESKDNSFPTVDPIDPSVYCGANKLAEAMVGWDFLGYHPKSGFTADGFNDLDGDGTAQLIYNPTAGFTDGTYTETADQNIENRRKFIDLENANAFEMQDIYEAGTVTGGGWTDSTNIVMGDVYAKNRLTGKKAGMPILYYRARQGYKFQDYTLESNSNADATDDDVYDFRDNENLLALNSPDDSSIVHPLYDTVNDLLDFEDIIVNQQVLDTSGIRLPYRSETYFLLSAGKDGLYGTADDILNFDKEITE
jgi:type II secretory pathway pseudopilin PulG